uniref:Protein kinase domain-containing protein n=2 Tax=Hordeum vulgare subsp. vulgare TaxID=112509 RepID=A0A8I7B899_HORVV
MMLAPTRTKIGAMITPPMLHLIAATITLAAAPPVALPGCPEACGNVTVPYPFGVGHGCFREGFNLTCDETSRQPPRLFAGDDAAWVQVVAVSLDGTLRVNTRMVNFSLSENPEKFNRTWSAGGLQQAGRRLTVSPKRNRFVALGCNLVASLVDDDGRFVSVCAAYCSEAHGPGRVSDGSCSGVGCCQTAVPRPGFSSYGIQINDLAQIRVRPNDSSRYGAVFVADREWFAEKGLMLQLDYSTEPQRIADSTVVPTVLEWSLDMKRDKDMFRLPDGLSTAPRRCISANSIVVYNDDDYQRPRCNCSNGYEGNPHIADGCQDIDECQSPGVYPCPQGTCINMPGTYQCSSTRKSIGRLPGLISGIAISAGFGLLFSLLGVAKITNKLKQRRAKKLRQKFFKKNHGLLLQQLISSNKNIAERTRIFSLEELEQATNKFDHNRILGGGGHGTVYKGILSDQSIVAIKKSKIVVQREINQFINEVVILSQTNHRNVVKLFGCCLETEVPLLVYEFISNGTLSFHLHGLSDNPLSWKDRLRIALETARAIAYLHSAASISVYHRDIKCANILLTDTLTAKVSDFGASRSIAIDETGILTAVQGTHGYLDPEYYYTSRLTEKSDVYSFGVILAELLTRVTPVFSSHSSEGRSLASHFVSLIRDKRLLDILDTQIVEEGGAEDAEVVARLVEACLSLKGEERPTMRQVETTLEDVQNSKFHFNSQIISVKQNGISDQLYKGSKGSEGTRLYSLEKEFIQSSEIPR